MRTIEVSETCLDVDTLTLTLISPDLSLISLCMMSNMTIVTIPVLYPDEEPVVAGRLSGRRFVVRVLEQLAVGGASLVVLDFARVEIATSSFLGEAVLELRDHLRMRRVATYLAVANLGASVREEMEDLLGRAGDALVMCSSAAGGTTSGAELIGHLDGKLLETFEMVRNLGEASAVDLHAASASSGVGPTAWNNRLSTLAAKGLLVEQATGRTKKYRPVMEII